jgi:polyhydroxybutyrate depolymerase
VLLDNLEFLIMFGAKVLHRDAGLFLLLCLTLMVEVASALRLGATQGGDWWFNKGKDYTIKLKSGGHDRSAILHLPPSSRKQSRQSIPLIVNFHAMALNGWAQQRVSNMDGLADKERFAVVYPTGLVKATYTSHMDGVPSWMDFKFGYTWNAGTCCPGATAEKVDDVKFTKDLIKHLISTAVESTSHGKFTIDPRRVYATGFSNGGFLTYRLACQEPNLFAAIAPVVAVLANGTGKFGWPSDQFTCAGKGRRPVPMIAFNGDQDPLVPKPGNPVMGFRSFQSNIRMMKKLNGIPRNDQGKISYTKRFLWTTGKCRAYGSHSRNVTFCNINTMGHGWPTKSSGCSATSLLPGAWCSDVIDFSKEAWSFFKQYRLP